MGRKSEANLLKMSLTVRIPIKPTLNAASRRGFPDAWSPLNSMEMASREIKPSWANWKPREEELESDSARMTITVTAPGQSWNQIISVSTPRPRDEYESDHIAEKMLQSLSMNCVTIGRKRSSRAVCDNIMCQAAKRRKLNLDSENPRRFQRSGSITKRKCFPRSLSLASDDLMRDHLR